MQQRITRHKIKVLLLDICKEMKSAQLLLVASSLAYTTILSIVPLIAVSLALLKAFVSFDELYQYIEPFIVSNLTEHSGQQATKILQESIEKVHSGTLGVTGLIGLFITSMMMLSSIEGAINRVWQAPGRKNIFQRVITYWFFMTAGPFALSISLAFTASATPSIVPKGISTFFMALGFFFVVYKWVPNRKVNWVSALSGAVFAAFFWTIAKIGFGLYAKNVVTYATIYGSLGAIPLLLIWIYILWIIVLSAAALSAAVQKRFELE